MPDRTSLIAYITGIFTTLLGSLSLETVAIIVGIGCTVGTFIVNWYYKARATKLAEKRLLAELKELQDSAREDI